MRKKDLTVKMIVLFTPTYQPGGNIDEKIHHRHMFTRTKNRKQNIQIGQTTATIENKRKTIENQT